MCSFLSDRFLLFEDLFLEAISIHIFSIFAYQLNSSQSEGSRIASSGTYVKVS